MTDSSQAGAPQDRFPQDLGAGLFLMAIALIGLWQGFELDAGTLREIGPGMLPRALAALTGLCGLGIAIRPFLNKASAISLERWHWRGSLFVLAAAATFAYAIRPLGFAVAGPLAIVLASLASRESKPVEIVAFAIVMTGLCIVLFRILLGLPIPVAPWLLDY